MNLTRIGIGLAVLATVATVLFNCRLRTLEVRSYGPGRTGEDVVAQLRGLRSALDGGAAEWMQELFPEGYVFTWALYGLAWVQVGMNAPPDSPRRRQAVRDARRAVRAIDSPTGRAPFTDETRLRWGAFYNGWLARLRGGILKIADEPREAEIASFRERCARIARALRSSSTPFLASYPQGSWPVDTVVAVSALRLHDQLYEPRYQSVVEKWIAEIRDSVDADTGLLPHRVDADTAESLQDPRGSSQALLLRFLLDVAPQLARRHYRRFRRHFADVRFGLVPGVREYPRGTGGPSDVDSGPIVFGFSGPATVVGMGTALAYGDRDLAEPLLRGTEGAGLPYRWGDHKRYGIGLLPVGDAFVVWSKTAQPWVTKAPRVSPRRELLGAGWLWRWHLVSFVVVLLFWLPPGYGWYRARRRTASNESRRGSQRARFRCSGRRS